MSETEITPGPFSEWVAYGQGLHRVDPAVTQVEIAADGNDRILILLRNGVVVEKLRLSAEAAAHLSALLAPRAHE